MKRRERDRVNVVLLGKKENLTSICPNILLCLFVSFLNCFLKHFIIRKVFLRLRQETQINWGCLYDRAAQIYC